MPASGPGPQCTAVFTRLGHKGPAVGKVALHAKEEALCQTAVEKRPAPDGPGGKGANLIKIPRARPLTRFQSARLNIGESWSGYCNQSGLLSLKRQFTQKPRFGHCWLHAVTDHDVCVHWVNKNDLKTFLRYE